MDKYLELRKRCLTLISRIAARAASSPYPGHARISLWELNYVLRESPYVSDDDDENLNADDELNKLDNLYKLLKFIDADSETYTAYHVLKFATRSTWN